MLLKKVNTLNKLVLSQINGGKLNRRTFSVARIIFLRSNIDLPKKRKVYSVNRLLL